MLDIYLTIIADGPLWGISTLFCLSIRQTKPAASQFQQRSRDVDDKC